MNELQERFTDTDYLGTCTVKQKPPCRKLAEQPYGDMCAEHGKARAWMRAHLGKEPYPDADQARDAEALRDLRAPVIVDDDLKPETIYESEDPADEIEARYAESLRRED